MKSFLHLPAAAIAGLLATAAPFSVNAQDQQNPAAELDAAFKKGDYDEVIKLSETLDQKSPLNRYRAEAFHRRGVERYYAGKVTESISDFDACIQLEPDRDPYHWQRGISYYHAGEFEKGKEQFERHQTVNSQDVENAVFHFICAVRAPGGSVEEARKNFIKIDQDPRVPMKQIHAFYAGTGTVDEVIEAAQAGDPSPDELKNHLCYAHLYLGLYFDATGDEEKAGRHMRLAAGKYRMDHYMGKVAQVHVKVRKLETEPKISN